MYFAVGDGLKKVLQVSPVEAVRGTYRIIPETSEGIRLLFEVLTEMKVKSANILLDEPVSNSGRLKALIAGIGENYPVSLDIRIRKDVDRELYGKENVITSDSVILDHCGSWINLMPLCLERHGGLAFCHKNPPCAGQIAARLK